MEWKYWNGKRIFVQLRSGAVYSGKVIDVDDRSHPIIFFSMIDKFGNKVTFVHSEILKIVEEEEEK